ncbi:MAG: SpoIVB peptidase S55 domain-containing protein [Lachnospiraceae bacterium]
MEKVNLAGSDPNKSMVISVTDPELLNLTGGIIQGMSGSPNTPERKTHRRRHPRLRPGFSERVRDFY